MFPKYQDRSAQRIGFGRRQADDEDDGNWRRGDRGRPLRRSFSQNSDEDELNSRKRGRGGEPSAANVTVAKQHRGPIESLHPLGDRGKRDNKAFNPAAPADRHSVDQRRDGDRKSGRGMNGPHGTQHPGNFNRDPAPMHSGSSGFMGVGPYSGGYGGGLQQSQMNRGMAMGPYGPAASMQQMGMQNMMAGNYAGMEAARRMYMMTAMMEYGNQFVHGGAAGMKSNGAVQRGFAGANVSLVV